MDDNPKFANVNEVLDYALELALQSRAELKVVRRLLSQQGITPDSAEYVRLCEVEYQSLRAEVSGMFPDASTDLWPRFWQGGLG